jgi:WD40 repeat protein
MTHPFGDLITQHLSRKYGFSQSKLAECIDQDAAVITHMCQGKRLSGTYARERVIKIVGCFQKEGVLKYLDEANALLEAAGMVGLRETDSVELKIIQSLQITKKVSESVPPQSTYTRRFPVKHNLPSPLLGSFWGREKEISEINRRLKPYPISNYHLVVIDGVGGVGKSSLALQIAHEFINGDSELPENEHFDTIVWASLKSTRLTPDGIIQTQRNIYTLHDIYRTIAIVLGKKEILDGPPEQLYELVRQLLAENRTLLIIDNFESLDTQQLQLVTDFLIELPAPTKAIVTTRSRIRIGHEIHLDGMPAEHAFLLMDQECEKEGISLSEEERGELYSRTGGIPLAIAWSIAQIGKGNTPSGVIRQLGQAQDDISQFCFVGLLDLIKGTNAYRIFLSLSLFSTECPRELLGIISDLGDDALSRDQNLAYLENHFVVRRHGESYGLIPLIKPLAFIELHQNPIEYYRLQNRLLSWVVERLSNSGNLSSENNSRYFLESEHELLQDLARECNRRTDLVNAGFLIEFIKTTPYIEQKDWQDIVREYQIKATERLTIEDWGTARQLEAFCGREKEIALLQDAILNDQYRVLAILGIGGIGKTSLAMKVAKHVKNSFDYVIWRSLANAPTLLSLLFELLQFFSHNQFTHPLNDPEQGISLLLGYLQKNRCLIILDNFETVLEKDDEGQHRQTYTYFNLLLKQVIENPSNSCLILTSREKPKELVDLEKNTRYAKSIILTGLENRDVSTFLKDANLQGSEEVWAILSHRYGGNPFALKVAAETIKQKYQGNIVSFLNDGHFVFGSFRNLLEQQFSQLTDTEKYIIFWLAVNRELVNLSTLAEDVFPPMDEVEILDVLRALSRKFLVEMLQDKLFTMQPVVMQYATDVLIGRAIEEIVIESPVLLRKLSLVKASSPTYVRDAQENLILSSISEKLTDILETKEVIQQHIRRIIEVARGLPQNEQGYISGNLLNLLLFMDCDIEGDDFSNLLIQQAYLQERELHKVNFTGSTFQKCDFAECFAGILTVALSPDDRLMAAGSVDGNTYIWRMRDLQLERILVGRSWVSDIGFNPNGNTIATSNYDATVQLWDLSSGECIGTFVGHSKWINSINFSPDGRYLASCSEDGTIRIWDLSTGQCTRILAEHEGAVTSIRFSVVGDHLFSVGVDQTIRTWDVDTGFCTKVLNCDVGPIRCLDRSNDGNLIATGSQDGTIRIWELATGECGLILPGHKNAVTSLAFNKKGDLLLTGSRDQTLRLFDLSTNQCIRAFVGHSNWVSSVAFDSTGELIVSGGLDQSIRSWDINTGSCIKTLQGHSAEIKSIAYNSDSALLAAGGNDGIVRVWDTRIGRCTHTLKGHTDQVWSVAFQAGEQNLASGSEDLIVRIWDMVQGVCVKELKGHDSWIFVRFSRDGKMLASSGSDDESVRIWRTDRWECFRVIPTGSRVWEVAFSPDHEFIATANYDQTIRIWNLTSGELQMQLKGHTDQVWSVDFSPDGKLLASGSEDRTVRVWDIQSGSCIKVLEAHKSWVPKVVFNRDGTWLASKGYDDDLILWETVTFEPRIKLGTAQSWTMDFAPTEDVIAEAGVGGRISFWNTKNGELLRTFETKHIYDQMDISGVSGLSQSQKEILMLLGAKEMTSHSNNAA